MIFRGNWKLVLTNLETDALGFCARYNPGHSARSPQPSATVTMPMPRGAPPSRTRSASPRGSLPLVPTDIPNVYRNLRTQALCDSRGVALSFLEVKAADEERFIEVVGEVPESPAALLKAVALDPRHPLDVRLSAARQAAPYYDMRMPMRVEGELKHTGVVFDPAKLAAMKKTDRELLLKMLKQLGVEL